MCKDCFVFTPYWSIPFKICWHWYTSCLIIPPDNGILFFSLFFYLWILFIEPLRCLFIFSLISSFDWFFTCELPFLKIVSYCWGVVSISWRMILFSCSSVSVFPVFFGRPTFLTFIALFPLFSYLLYQREVVCNATPNIAAVYLLECPASLNCITRFRKYCNPKLCSRKLKKASIIVHKAHS